MRRAAGLAGLLICLSLVGAATWLVSGLWEPAAADGPGQVFRVADREPLGSIARRLEAQRLLPRRWLFGPRTLVLFARVMGVDREIKAGEYDLAPTMTPLEVLDHLVTGRIKTYAVTIPEGLRIEEVGERFAAAGIVDANTLASLAWDPNLSHALGIAADSLEGYLYPETYRFRRDTPAREVLAHMVATFRERWDRLDVERRESVELSPHEVITLASIIEKETGAAEERPRIAAVFLNRLERGMRLQSDPTVIYGILRAHGSFDGNLRTRDLRADSPYNTYTRSGLPAGPIASPSLAAIRAVLAPEQVPYLYFVSRNDGTHQFSRTLREHNRAVDRYQRRRSKRAAPG